jgi:hypothetical protein
VDGLGRSRRISGKKGEHMGNEEKGEKLNELSQV